MREIKFRAWVDNKRMVDYERIWNSYNVCDLFGSANAIPMQYTGLNDKNGREIYEGDMVRFVEYGNPLEVKFGEYEPEKPWTEQNEKLYGFYFESHKTEFVYSMKDCEQCVIIGNIYENPELLG